MEFNSQNMNSLVGQAVNSLETASLKGKGIQSLEDVSKQFEAIFMRLLFKSMRQANNALGKGFFDSNAMGMYQQLFDEKLASTLSLNKGMGLSNMMINKLSKFVPEHKVNQSEETSKSLELSRYISAEVIEQVKASVKTLSDKISRFATPSEFVNMLWPLAVKIGETLNLDPKVLVAQSALETGWGKHIIQDKNGNNSHNLFGIKADQRWNGAQVVVDTIEYDDNILTNNKAAFRAYDSYADSIQDYMSFLKSNPRYQKALDNTTQAYQYINELKKAGYATDPDYANKIKSIYNGDILKTSLESISS